jgi:hypothetical protein
MELSWTYLNVLTLENDPVVEMLSLYYLFLFKKTISKIWLLVYTEVSFIPFGDYLND